MGITSNKIIVDSGTSFLLMPETDYSNLQAIFEKKYICDRKIIYNGLLSCEIGYFEYIMTDFPPLRITMGEHMYEIPQDSYLLWAGDEIVFKIMTMPDSSWDIDFWILGLNFFHHYYTIFDMDEKTVGFTPSIADPEPPSWRAMALLGLNQRNNEEMRKLTGQEPRANKSAVAIVLIASLMTFAAIYLSGIVGKAKSICKKRVDQGK